MGIIKKLTATCFPSALKTELKKTLSEISSVTENAVLSSVYTPPHCQRHESGGITWSKQPKGRPTDGLLFLPPADLRMNYGADDQEFLSTGESTARAVRASLDRVGVKLTEGSSVLEWGCATGRVLRHFAEEAKGGEFWGVDRESNYILWAKQNLSPTFKFLTCTSFPHFPFEDRKFDVVYAISVFTHLFHLVDMWLMEFRRVLAPGGCALFTILDQHTWQYLAENKGKKPFWLGKADLSKGMQDDVVFLGGENGYWDQVYTFFKTDWIERDWGQYFDVIAIEPFFDSYQTAVLLRKPKSEG
jgi:ubiquinone/menaquinone biosynthesis C-methylase UbiE